MFCRQQIVNIVVALVMVVTPAVATRGEDYEAMEKLVEELRQDLSHIDTTLKLGDNVVVLRDTALMVGTQTVATARKGDRFAVEQIQDKWLGVKSGQTYGWVEGGSVLNTRLVDWYGRLPNNTAVMASGQIRAKFDGVLFEVTDPGSEFVYNFFEGSINGFSVPNCVYANAKNVGVMVAKASGRNRVLSLRFPGGRNIFPEMPALRPYGTVAQDDYVIISAATRQVIVNGQHRQITAR